MGTEQHRGGKFKFWLGMGVFQVVFGLAVFSLTREYYRAEPVRPVLTNAPVSMIQPNISWGSQPKPLQPGNLTAQGSAPEVAVSDPQEISRLADEAFSQQRYDQAAELYQRLLTFDRNSVGTYNNLGLTQHYIGQSGTALKTLQEGITVDPDNQRIWLTLGFVRSQTGDTAKARSALETAVAMDPASKVGQSAAKMLDSID